MKYKIKKNIKIIIGVIMLIIVLIISLIIASSIRNTSLKVNGIFISQMPQKVEFYEYEDVIIDDLEVSAILNNGELYTLNLSECEIIGYGDIEGPGSYTILIKYLNFTCEYNIIIHSTPSYSKEIIALEIKQLPDKLEYKLGEWLDCTGGVLLLVFSDGTSEEVELKSKYVKGFNITDLGEYDLTVVYNYNGEYVYTSYKINVVD